MNEYSYEQELKGENIIIKFFVIFLIFAGIISVLFTNYKQETLICSKTDDICYIRKINLINMNSRRKLVKYSEINKVSFIPQKVKGNRFAQGYTFYLLTFYKKNNDPVVIFSSAYLDKNEIKNAVNEIHKQMKNNQKEIKYNR